MQRRVVFEQRLIDAKKRLAERKEYNRDAWETYGSELCARELEATERVIRNEISHLEMLLSMPEMDMNQEQLIEKMREINKQIMEIQQGIEEFKTQMELSLKGKLEKEAQVRCVNELAEVPLEP
ncbi:MAG: hypothetical protein A3H51_00040 [Candidatus Spechtbacteria bacterium RIFCSPLOWO2_02_FULL_38_8]|uniref:Uncharacterized protein n=1 Tax=Candidatus Spechtbacteria bacterium RIFCSPLOWO2_02_FULL_38_8 TaxID=1802164 RepID=A0A1G2HHJ6_9BACT|nr:MAG: hypothetical protein A3H51_00040 [Candidatus Spechtbacteria bacterium RIFCSPLOWO2_02_FULL_38_8]